MKQKLTTSKLPKLQKSSSLLFMMISFVIFGSLQIENISANDLNTPPGSDRTVQ